MINSFVKPANLLLAGYSYLKGSVADTKYIKGMPPFITTELTNFCNLNCPQCSSGSGIMSRERGFMAVDLYKKIMKELSPYLYNVNLYFQGEPMLHPSFVSFIENCPGAYTVVSTNGHFLSEETSEKIVCSGLKRLIISLDGTDQKTYSTYRINGSMDKVLNGLNNITKAKEKYKSSLKIEIQFLVNRFNEHQVPLVKQLARKFHTSLNFKSMQIIDKSDISSWLPKTRRFRRYRVKEGEYVLKNSLPDRCPRLWFNPVITWDGKVIPCCFDKDAEFVMGNLNDDSFRDIWNGPKYRIFRRSILTGRHMIEICRNCTSGLSGARY
jgi:radical SAM protein with 4Fe4S-binding SPASM domain